VHSIVVVGAGLAGFRAAQSLRKNGFAGTLTIIGDEVHRPYDRPPLSKQLLSGTYTREQCMLPGEVEDVIWLLGRPAAGLDLGRGVITVADGTEVGYDGLIIATGRRARPWPGPAPAEGVMVLRSLDDVERFQGAVADESKVVIIGAGFIGCEVAATLRQRGVDITIVDVCEHPMPAMGPEVGERAIDLHTAHGVKFRLGQGVESIDGTDRVTGITLADGEQLDADVVLVAIGTVANSEWLAETRIALDGGAVLCDIYCGVLDSTGEPIPGVTAAGDGAAWPHRHGTTPVCIEHWSNARDMADCAAANLLAEPAERRPLNSVPAFWSDQYNVKIKSAGYLRAADHFTVVSEDWDNTEKPSLLVEALHGDEVVGAIAMNMNKAILKYQRELAAAPAAQ
jgi:3-phenylpropionate/trans-cinnamate dioxygenase ferredoxin reductase component